MYKQKYNHYKIIIIIILSLLALIFVGNCMVVKENDICGSNSVPIRCDNNEAATKCLCNVGIRSTENNTCLGKLT